ncbi:sulfur carrier protein ThiS [Silvibacterium dinghuense]|uniref:Sulfur carrier protein ThiS n=1 Tax=Silvibacterium dinghuense TaxID=1560006 RepID=A0A4Q1SD60_9BACT|nr:sulfur carrier protein ThiS [Silvibacterium dinghuense]RXS95154.1 sulfur carrier protein ThiS [Silvibacterium dinghuense]GGH11119.1 thiamine biosynthesis protein ThiS [Silvibacterium dinghuense]
MQITLNGQDRTIDDLPAAPTVADLITSLALKGDRIAVEQNGEIVPRSTWAASPVASGDKFEIVHFVGGGC